MKTVLIFSVLFYAIAMPAIGTLTDADLDKIRLIIQEEISKEIKPLKDEIETLETDIRDEIGTLKIDTGAIKTEITNLKENVNYGFDNVQKNFDRQNNIIACIGIPMAILAIGATVWGLLAHRRNEKDLALERQVETLTREIEALKQ